MSYSRVTLKYVSSYYTIAYSADHGGTVINTVARMLVPLLGTKDNTSSPIYFRQLLVPKHSIGGLLLPALWYGHLLYTLNCLALSNFTNAFMHTTVCLFGMERQLEESFEI